jgi:hypothetical protein
MSSPATSSPPRIRTPRPRGSRALGEVAPNSRADRPAFRVHDRYIRRSGYLTSSPVTVRPISIRWISDVPSKMVKIVDYPPLTIG